MYPEKLIAQTILHTASMWVNTQDDQGNITLWNRAAEKISGYSQEEVIGKNDIWHRLYPDDRYREMIFARAQDILTKGKKLENFESAIRTKSGRQIILSWSTHHLIDQSGKNLGSIAIARDVTHQRSEKLNLQSYALELKEQNQTLTHSLGLIYEMSDEPLTQLELLQERLANGDTLPKEAIKTMAQTLLALRQLLNNR